MQTLYENGHKHSKVTIIETPVMYFCIVFSRTLIVQYKLMFCFIFILYKILSETCKIDDYIDDSDAEDMEVCSESVNDELQDLLLDSDNSRPSSQSSSRPTSSLSFSHDVIK